MVNYSLHFVDPTTSQHPDSGELLKQGEDKVHANDGCELNPVTSPLG